MTDPVALDDTLIIARLAQKQWAAQPLCDRVAVVRRFRHALAMQGEAVAMRVTEALPTRREVAETMTAEVIPLAAAAKWLERSAGAILQSRTAGMWGRPVWLMGCRSQVRRAAWGVVGVIGPGNYPLILPGVQVLQALTAGNAVVLKPGRNGTAAAEALRDLLDNARLPAGLLTVLNEDLSASKALLEPREYPQQGLLQGRIDKVIVTGSSATGRAVLEACARTLTPASLELSGVDAAWVLPGAERTPGLNLIADALVWGITLNSGATCIAPRRVMVHASIHAALIDAMVKKLQECHTVDTAMWYPGAVQKARDAIRDATQRGATVLWPHDSHLHDPVPPGPIVITNAATDMALMRQDTFGPVLAITPWRTPQDAQTLDAACPYALNASVFGPPRDATAFAEQLNVGGITINDLIAPTADPRLPFGGSAASGYGVTRGPEGLIAMTRPQVLIQRRGRLRPHYDPSGPQASTLFNHFLKLTHAPRFTDRLKSFTKLIKAASQSK